MGVGAGQAKEVPQWPRDLTTGTRICDQISSTHKESQTWFCTTVTPELGGRVQDRKLPEGF